MSRGSGFYLWMRVLLWYGIICALSSMPDYTGKGPDFETVLGIGRFCIRKSGHLIEYAVLMILIQRAVIKTWKVRGQFLPAFVITLLLASLDEWHQTFIYGRTGTEMDVFVDSVGAAGGLFLWDWRLQDQWQKRIVPKFLKSDAFGKSNPLPK